MAVRIRCRPLAAVVGGAALSLASACGGSASSSSGTVVTPPTIASVHFASTDTLFLNEGDSVQLAPQALDPSGQPVTATFTYAVAAGTSATVDGQGYVLGAAPGVSSVSASAGGLSATRVVAVFGHPANYDAYSVPLGDRPYGLAVTGKGDVFVTQLDGASVSRLTLRPLAWVSRVSVGQTPTGISANPAGTQLAVSNQFDPSFGFLDVASGVQVSTIAAPATTFRTIFSRDGSRVYGTASNGALLVMSASNRAEIGTVNIAAAANGMVWGPDSTTLYVTSMLGTIAAIDVATGATTASVNGGAVYQDAVVSRDGKHLFVADESRGSVDEFSLPGLTPDVAILLPVGAFGLALSPDGQRLYATEPAGHAVAVLDPINLRIVQNVDLSIATSTPRRVAFDRFGSVAIVTDEDGRVWTLGSPSGP